METLAHIQQKLAGAEDLKSVVRTMKAMAASRIGEYELAVDSLSKYHRTIALGILAYFSANPADKFDRKVPSPRNKAPLHCAIIFGSDQGLVGPFNDTLASFAADFLADLPGDKEVWSVGERMRLRLADTGFIPAESFPLPGTVEAITPLVSKILMRGEEDIERGRFESIYVFHNQPKAGAGYTPTGAQLLPLDEAWKQRFLAEAWPTKLIPQVAGGPRSTLLALIHEYLFTSLFKACAESLASENGSRLIAMQRAEKNIGELLDDLNHQYHQLRQGLIDEELFDVISGFEALRKRE